MARRHRSTLIRYWKLVAGIKIPRPFPFLVGTFLPLLFWSLVVSKLLFTPIANQFFPFLSLLLPLLFLIPKTSSSPIPASFSAPPSWSLRKPSIAKSPRFALAYAAKKTPNDGSRLETGTNPTDRTALRAQESASHRRGVRLCQPTARRRIPIATAQREDRLEK